MTVLGVADDDFWAALRARTDDIATEPRPDCDSVLFAVNGDDDLARVPGLQKLVRPDGALWLVRPKGPGGVHESKLMEAGLAIGLVDNKVVSFSPTHSAMRFVWRLRDR